MLAHFLLPFLAAFLAQAYTPALPTNDTKLINIYDNSTLDLTFAPANGEPKTEADVVFLLPGTGSNATSQGALVGFSEDGLTNDKTKTPWIALISCDANSTSASSTTDIFTLAKDRGAVAALLFTQFSKSCVLPSPASSSSTGPLSLYTFKSNIDSSLILSQFSDIPPQFQVYDAAQLNASFNAVNDAIKGKNVSSNSTEDGVQYIVGDLENDTNNKVPSDVPQSGAVGRKVQIGLGIMALVGAVISC